MGRALVLAVLLLAPLAALPHAGALHTLHPAQWTHAATSGGAVWFEVSGMQDAMSFAITLPDRDGYEVGLTILDPDAGWRYDVTGRPYDSDPARVDLWQNGGRMLRLEPLSVGSGISTGMGGSSPCDGGFSFGGSWGGGQRTHFFAFDYDEGCAIPQTAQVLAWVAARSPGSWSVSVGAPAPVSVEVLEESGVAAYRTAAAFPGRASAVASASLLVDDAHVEAAAGDGEFRLSVQHGIRGAFAGASGSVGLRATASGPGGVRTCPCGFVEPGPGEWTFRVEGAGAADGELRLVAVDTSFPW